jgi:tRNA pseudouridine38-40 synthase
MRVLKLTLQYDGTDYVGWQRQAHGLSIQGLVEDALARFDGQPVTVIGAGRTDAGVHALGQVASVRLAHPVAAPDLCRALNGMLPADVRVLCVEPAAEGFHARYDARSKTYCYRVASGPVASPFDHRYAWHVAGNVDFGRVADAGRLLVGRHDFAAFQSAGSAIRTSTRTVFSLDVRREPPGWAESARESGQSAVFQISVTADGFLRHMVRAIVGTLIETGMGRRTPEDVAALVQSRDRARAGTTAPPRGLFLVRVTY